VLDSDVTFAPVAGAIADGLDGERDAMLKGRRGAEPSLCTSIRLGVYTDMAYRADGDGIYTGRAFVRFLTEMPPRVAELTVFGRLDPTSGRAPYRLPNGTVRFVALPYYRRISSIGSMLRSVAKSCHVFAAELDRLDAVWIFGPQPMAVVFAWLARWRGKPLVLGVRQDYPRYIASRLPGRSWRWALAAAHVLDIVFRRLAKRAPTVAVGDDLARRYSVGGPVLSTGFSLVPRSALQSADLAIAKNWDAQRTVLSVGRLDPEKNPLLLLDIAERLRELDSRWRLVIAGTGPLRAELDAEIARRRLEENVELLGEVANGADLWSLYRQSHVFLHVSLTEGVPQVLFEAQAAGVPIIATAVGGVRGALDGGNGGLLMEPDNAVEAVSLLNRLADDPALRRRLIESGLEQVSHQTQEAQLDRIVMFIRAHVS
jgi:glycosyltransferase involved in cell wall biosynthesis